MEKLHANLDDQGLKNAVEFPAVQWWVSSGSLAVPGIECIKAMNEMATVARQKSGRLGN